MGATNHWPKMPNSSEEAFHIIQVLVDFPRPDSTSKENFYEDTMLLLQMVRDKKQKENKEKKVNF